MNTRIENLKHIPRHDQLGFDPEPPGTRFAALCPRERAARVQQQRPLAVVATRPRAAA